jgi:hypothetical protein
MVLHCIEHIQELEHAPARKCRHVNSRAKGAGGRRNVQTKQEVKVICERFKLSSKDAQQLTRWIEVRGSMSVIQMEPWRYMMIHFLDRMSWGHVRDLNGTPETHCNLQTG